MPIETDLPLQPASQSRFGRVAYEVVGHAFEVHRRLGRIFDESVYRTTLKEILSPRAADEVRIHLTHADFEKVYIIDLLVDSGCPFELKVASRLHDRHRGQMIQYLMLTDLQHGKLLNFGGEHVEHEFVNCRELTEHRRSFDLDVSRWSPETTEARGFQTMMIDLLRDWGTGLDRALYNEAITHFLGGPDNVRQPIDALWGGTVVGSQKANLVVPATAFEITSLRRGLTTYEKHLRRFLANTSLERVWWVNIVSGMVTFTELRQKNGAQE